MVLIYPVKRDADWQAWGRNAVELLTATPSVYPIPVEQATAIKTAFDAYSAAYDAAVSPMTRSRNTIQAKDTALKAFRTVVSPAVAVIRTSLELSDEQRTQIGVRVRHVSGSIQTVPQAAPSVTVLMTGPNSARVLARNPLSPGSRRKPSGAKEVAVLVHMGTNPDPDVMQWPTSTISGRTDVDLYWPGMVGETTVWVSCYWVGSRRQVGKFSVPVSVRLPGIGGQSATLGQTPAEPTMKIAA